MEEGGALLHHPLRVKHRRGGGGGGGGDGIGIVPASASASASAFVDHEESTPHAQQAVVRHRREVVVLLVGDDGVPPPSDRHRRRRRRRGRCRWERRGPGRRKGRDGRGSLIIITASMPPKIIAPPFQRSIPSSSSEPISSPLLTVNSYFFVCTILKVPTEFSFGIGMEFTEKY
jgi:hypothetical protein